MNFSIGDLILSAIGTAIAIFLGVVVRNTNKSLELIQKTREEYVPKSDCNNIENNRNHIHIRLEEKIEKGFRDIHNRLDEVIKHIDWKNGNGKG